MTLLAGVSVKDITPVKPLYLTGYPHTERVMTGVSDPLLSSALRLDGGDSPVIMIALDLLFIDTETARELRKAVQAETGVPEKNVFISCTHTHSGPLTAKVIAWKNDPTVPEPDAEYMRFLRETVTASALEASENLFEAEAAWTSASVSGVSGNRHDPAGVRDPEAGILAVRRASDKKLMSVSVIYGAHPTVLHEDSKLVSSDFPGFARKYLREKTTPDLTVLYHPGPAGNQGPRHHVKAQTVAEAERLGVLLGGFLWDKVNALTGGDFTSDFETAADIAFAELPRKQIPSMKEALANLKKRHDEFESLKKAGAGHGPVRTAECAVFGAEETIALAEAGESGELAKAAAALSPADVQVLKLGEGFLAGFPGEIFAEHGLELKKRFRDKVFPVSLVNGHLQGYITTEEAVRKGCYEASFSVFSPAAGGAMIEAAAGFINKMSAEI
jgi:hypothetical protein